LKPGRHKGPSINQVVLSIINKIESPVFSSKEIIQKCSELGYHYNLGTIYRALNKLGREQRLKKLHLSRDGKRAVDWKKINIQPLLISENKEGEQKEKGLNQPSS
jgi:Fe2+ or Zn2+ uptake regulation protein